MAAGYTDLDKEIRKNRRKLESDGKIIKTKQLTSSKL